MPAAEQHHLRQFLLFVFALLAPCFALWTLASARLAVPAVGLVNLILGAWFPDVVNVVYPQGADAVLMTRFDTLDGQLVPTNDPQTGVGFVINTRILSYSLPFYAALHFATGKQAYLADFFWGVLLLYPFFVLGLLCLCLKELMINLGSLFLEQPGIFVPPPGVIAIAYQLSVLIIPTLAPAVVWAWQSRQSPLIRGALASLYKTPDVG